MIAPAGGVAPFRFSTDDVAPCDRTAVWREVLGKVHLHLDVESVGEGPLRATVESHSWSRASLYFSDTTPVRASRTSELVQDGDGDFRLLRADGAGFQFTANGIEETVSDGNAALLFNGVVGAVRYLGPCRVSAVRVRRADLAALVRGFDDQAFRRIAPGAPAASLLAGYIALLRRDGPTADPVLASRVATHLTDLVALALEPSGDAAEHARGRSVGAARLRAIKADIAANLSDPGLQLAVVAMRHRVTPRYVRMLFEAEGQNFTAFVLEQRLARARDMLRDARFADHGISAIAFDSGFGDLSYFNRTFRQRFGASPSEIRAQIDADR
jgi:AraC-like DNA-binding protein